MSSVNTTIDLTKVTRFEVIDSTERAFDYITNGRNVIYDRDVSRKMTFSLQDDGLTLKVFIEPAQKIIRKCVVCYKDIAFDADHKMIKEATQFTTHGNYGSSISDDGNRRAVYLCDPCLKTAITAEACEIVKE